MTETPPTRPGLPPLWLALLPIVLTLGLLALQLFYYGDFTPHIPLILGLAITGLLGVLRGQGGFPTGRLPRAEAAALLSSSPTIPAARLGSRGLGGRLSGPRLKIYRFHFFI